MRVSAGALAIGLVVGAVVLDDASAVSRRKECRQSCRAAIDACVAQGGKRKRCKRQTLKRCREQGPAAVCAVTTTTTMQGGTTTTGSGGTTTTNPGGTSTTTVTTPGATTTTAPASVHGCSLATATDLRGEASPEVSFSSFYYLPKCARIQAGQSITFTGDLEFHPLVGGQVVGNDTVVDPQSPIGTHDGGFSATIAFPAAGTFPYYCDNHVLSYDMFGAVFVDP